MKKMLREAELQRVQGELRRADVKTERRWPDENISSVQCLWLFPQDRGARKVF